MPQPANARSGRSDVHDVSRTRSTRVAFATIAIALGGSACDSSSTAPVPVTLADEVRALAVAAGFEALAAPPSVRPELALLGQMLVFDPELSGNRDLSCMTCHWPEFGTADARSLSVGVDATGLGPDRVHPTGVFIPRNAPPTFNLHAQAAQFWDGRVEVDESGLFHTPAGTRVTPDMTDVFEFGSISAQGLFPVTSRDEMRAESGNELAAIDDGDEPAMWIALMARLGNIPEYRQLFEDAYPGTAFDDMSFAHAANAMAGFYLDEFTFVNTPWDQFLRGDDGAMSTEQLEGARSFIDASCGECHSGAALTDVKFHNVAVPQLGPGKGDGASGRDDFGRMRVTGDPADRYRFRTPPLRNVELTGPYGHAGAFTSLREFIDHYSESDQKLRGFDPSGLEVALQGTVLNNVEAVLATRDTLLDDLVLSEEDIDAIAAFITALTDPATSALPQSIPATVPSGLPVRASIAAARRPDR